MTSAKAATFAVALLAAWLTGVAAEIEYYGTPDLDDNYYGDPDLGENSYDYYDYSYGSFDELDADNVTTVVVNGTPAAESFGYTVAVGSFGRTGCGGWLYNEYTVITAAHCVANPFGLVVTVDRYDLRSRTEGQVISVEKTVIHSDYIPASEENDIAILKLTKPAKINVPYAKLIGEASRSQLNADTELIVLGWGSIISEGVQLPTDLRQGTVGYVDSKTCDEKYYGNVGRVTDQMVCARSTNNQDSCTGDGGGPLVLQTLFGADQIVGIVGSGGACNEVGKPTIYTAMTEEIKGWIIDVVTSL